MENQLQIFKNDIFKGYEVRIFGDNNNPLFVVKDIADIIGLKQYNKKLSDLNIESCITKCNIDTGYGIKGINCITEQGLYKLLFRTHNKIAEEFTNYVCELLKSLRLNQSKILEDKIKMLEEKEKINGVIYKMSNPDGLYYTGKDC